MSLLVENGSGVAGADSYVATVDCAAYAAARGLPFGSGDDADAAIRRGSAYIDNTYRIRFPGYRTFRRAQGLEWPRTGAFYTYPDNVPPPYFYGSGFGGYGGFGYAWAPYDPIGVNVIPPEVIAATCEAAVREFNEPGVLLPDLERGGGVSLLKAGSVEVKYGAGSSAVTVFQAIDAALSGLIQARSSLSARATRG